MKNISLIVNHICKASFVICEILLKLTPLETCDSCWVVLRCSACGYLGEFIRFLFLSFWCSMSFFFLRRF